MRHFTALNLPGAGRGLTVALLLATAAGCTNMTPREQAMVSGGAGGAAAGAGIAALAGGNAGVGAAVGGAMGIVAGNISASRSRY
ncbi:MAG: hypothetical protein ACFCBW_20825 [Candidatus Competibacterales bacterium]